MPFHDINDESFAWMRTLEKQVRCSPCTQCARETGWLVTHRLACFKERHTNDQGPLGTWY